MVITDILPSCPEIERSIIASFLSSRSLWVKFGVDIFPNYFYSTANQKIFAFMQESNCNDLRVIAEKYPDLKEEICGIKSEYSPGTSIYPQIEILRDRFERRNLIETSQRAQEAAFSDFDTPAQDITNSAIAGLSNAIVSNSKPEHIQEIIPRVIADMQNTINGGYGMKTGLADLDELMGGFLDSEMVILAGRPSMGKTTLALQIARYNAIFKDIPSLIFSIETSKNVMAGRILSSEANSCYDNALRGNKAELTKIGAAVDRVKAAGIYIDDTAAIPISQIESKTENYVKNHGIKLVIIDHVGLIKNNIHGRSRHEELSIISKAIKAIGKRFNIPTITLCQLSREVERRKPPIPMLSDLRESGSFEEDADKVLFLYREEYYNRKSDKKGIAEIIVAKNKNGKTGHREVVADLNTMNFRTIEKKRGEVYTCDKKESENEW
jgi:replicative DNA helicase